MAKKSANDYFQRGIEYFNQNDLDQAIIQFTEAVKLDPALTDARNNLAVVYSNRGIRFFKEGNKKQAIADLTESARYNPDDLQTFGTLGYMYENTGNFNEAIDTYNKVINSFDSNTSNNFKSRIHSSRSGVYGMKCKEIKGDNEGDNEKYLKFINAAISDLEAGLKYAKDDPNANPESVDLEKEALKLLHSMRERHLKFMKDQ